MLGRVLDQAEGEQCESLAVARSCRQLQQKIDYRLHPASPISKLQLRRPAKIVPSIPVNL